MREPDERATDRSDAVLLDAYRAGDRAALAELWSRHVDVGRAYARSLTTRFDPDDLVAEAFLRIIRATRTGSGPTGAFRAYLLTVIRNTASNRGSREREYPVEDPSQFGEMPVADPADAALTADRPALDAFGELPERWRDALWLSEVEGLTAREVGAALGISANSAAALTYRAREGLRQTFIQQRLVRGEDGGSTDGTEPPSRECRFVRSRAAAYVRGAVSARVRRRIDEHLAGCHDCSEYVERVRAVALRVPLLVLFAGLGAGAATLLRPGESALAGTLIAGSSTAAAVPPAGAGAAPAVGGAAGTGTAAGATGAHAGFIAATSFAGVGLAVLAAVVFAPAPVSPTVPASPSAITHDGRPEPPPPGGTVAAPTVPPAGPVATTPPGEPPARPIEPAPVVAPRAEAAAFQVDPLQGQQQYYPEFSGTARPGTGITAVAGDQAAAPSVQVVAAEDGSWRLPPLAVPAGTTPVVITAVQHGGRTDAVAVAVELIVPTACGAPISAAGESARLEVEILGEPGAVVAILDDGAVIASGELDPAGATAVGLARLPAQDHALVVRYDDGVRFGAPVPVVRGC